MDEQTRITGWGYEGKSAEDLLEFANQRSVVAVVDVRLHAVSRKADFRKRALESTLADAGIAYRHLPALGNPKDNREAFAQPGSDAAAVAHQRFRDEVVSTSEARRALDEVAALAQTGVVALLCYEDEESCCHRSLILDEFALSDAGA